MKADSAAAGLAFLFSEKAELRRRKGSITVH
jgi:hypothetical protein